jgi:hypothetical protein
MKKVLSIHFSQSGQLTEIVDNFTSQLTDCEIENQHITPTHPFPFPWTTPVFFDKMPETVLEKEIELNPISYQHEQYDLIVLGYQPWFLSPSLPVTALLKDEKFKAIVKDTPVVTLIGSRNMWLNSQESIKQLIVAAEGKLAGNVALADKASNLVGVVTILHWMLTGQKTKKWGIFPTPGVSDEDIEGVKKFGSLTNSALQQNTFDSLQQNIISEGGAPINTSILFIEGKAKRIFYIWANLITKKAAQGKRTFWVNAFKYYLIFVLFVVSPILLTFYYILVWPFTQKSLKSKKAYFQQVKLKI